MMMYEDAIAGPEGMRRGTCLLDHADRLMTQHAAGLAPDVPGHNVAGADSAGACAHQDIAGADLGARGLFDANVAKIV
jgi:hypothetical protein